MNRGYAKPMRVFVLAALAALGACSVRIDEQSVFRPMAREAPAETVAQLSRWPLAQMREAVPDAEARHGFVGEGDARIAYTVVSRASTAADARRPLIVYCGGNSGDRYNSGVFYALKALPYGDVMLLDYPGYGDSPGVPNSARLDAMAQPVSALAVSLAGERPLVFWGHSLGGFVCTRMVRITPQTDGVVLEATARRAIDVAKAWRPWFATPFVRLHVADSLASYDVAGALSDFHGPVLVLGARRDDTLPVPLARALADALRAQGSRVTYVEFAQARHMDISRQPDFPAAASSFFDSVAGQP